MRSEKEMKLLRQAEELEEAAMKITAECRELMDCHGSINASWKGDSATVYLRKVSALEEEMSQISSGLRTAAEEIRAAVVRAGE